MESLAGRIREESHPKVGEAFVMPFQGVVGKQLNCDASDQP